MKGMPGVKDRRYGLTCVSFNLIRLGKEALSRYRVANHMFDRTACGSQGCSTFKSCSRSNVTEVAEASGRTRRLHGRRRGCRAHRMNQWARTASGIHHHS